MVASQLVELFARANMTHEEAAAYRNQCTLETCDITTSYFYYLPNLGANVALAVLFGLTLVGFVVQGAVSRRFLGFSIAMISGTILEVLGYAGRVAAHKNPWSENNFLIQIICLTIAPAFLAAGIYLTLSRIVTTFGADNSRIPAKWYPRIFIPCDVGSLMLQAAGGGIASAATHSNKSPDVGDHIMVTGLAIQVFTLLIFICLSLDFAIKTLFRMKKLGREGALDPSHKMLRDSKRFRLFLGALSLATLCIFIRSVFRVAELGEGWTGDLIRNQNLFIGLEGVMVIIAVILLVVWHPGVCFREGDASERGFCGFGKKNKTGAVRGQEKDGAGNESGTESREEVKA